MKYLCCYIWRGSITISSMRVFDKLDEALDFF